MSQKNNIEPSLSVNDMVQFSHLQTDPIKLEISYQTSPISYLLRFIIVFPMCHTYINIHISYISRYVLYYMKG
jgi:hypothetical protein